MRSYILAVATLAFASEGLAIAVPHGHRFIAPKATDVRSPCPGLNTLANHGFINRNGRNMTIPALVAGGKAGMNMGADFMTAIGGAGILSNPNPALNYFDLDMLREHNFPIEHDGSLSRQDHYFGNWYDFNPTAYNQWISSFGSRKKTSIASAAKAKFNRVNDSLTRNPEVVYGPREFILSYGETSLYLQTMGSSTTSGVAPLSYVRSLFEKQRLPYEQGWAPPPDEVTLLTLAAMITRLDLANGEALPEGLEVITVGAVKDAFSGLDPITGKLLNITGGIIGGLDGVLP